MLETLEKPNIKNLVLETPERERLERFDPRYDLTREHFEKMLGGTIVFGPAVESSARLQTLFPQYKNEINTPATSLSDFHAMIRKRISEIKKDRNSEVDELNEDAVHGLFYLKLHNELDPMDPEYKEFIETVTTNTVNIHNTSIFGELAVLSDKKFRLTDDRIKFLLESFHSSMERALGYSYELGMQLRLYDPSIQLGITDALWKEWKKELKYSPHLNRTFILAIMSSDDILWDNGLKLIYHDPIGKNEIPPYPEIDKTGSRLEVLGL